MSYILDIIIVVILGLCAWRGYKSGILVSFLGIVAIIISIFAGNLLAKTYYGDFAGVMHPFVGGMVDGAVTTTLGVEALDYEMAAQAESEEKTAYIVLDVGAVNQKDAEKNQVEDAVKTVYLVSEAAQEDVWTVGYASLLNLGVSEKSAEQLATELTMEVTTVNQAMSDCLGTMLCDRLAFVIVFAAAFILASIVFLVIGNIIDVKFTLPGAEIINDIGGAALGVVRGILVVLAITAVFRYAGIFLPESWISKTWLLEGFIKHNAVAGAIGI